MTVVKYNLCMAGRFGLSHCCCWWIHFFRADGWKLSGLRWLMADFLCCDCCTFTRAWRGTYHAMSGETFHEKISACLKALFGCWLCISKYITLKGFKIVYSSCKFSFYFFKCAGFVLEICKPWRDLIWFCSRWWLNLYNHGWLPIVHRLFGTPCYPST